MHSTRSRRRVAIVASTGLIFGTTAAACGEDVIDDDVEKEIDEIDEDINDFVDTVFTDDSTETTGG
jgi:hypothetical protein